jgi:hypothetical protein
MLKLKHFIKISHKAMFEEIKALSDFIKAMQVSVFGY